MPARRSPRLLALALVSLALLPLPLLGQAAGTIRGVVFSVEGKPVGGATVKAGAVSASTDKNGLFSLKVKPGSYDVTATHPRFTQDTQKAVVKAGGTADVSLVLAPK